MSVQTLSGEKAWEGYLEIRNTIEGRKNTRIDTYEINIAIYRLGKAIIHNYQLDAGTHNVARSYNTTLQLPKPGSIKFYSFRNLLDLKVTEWESAIASVQVGHDVYTEGRTAGYRPQPSVQEALDLDYFEIQKIVKTTPEQALATYNRVNYFVQIELTRLRLTDYSAKKIIAISKTIKALAAAVAYKYDITVDGAATLSLEQKRYVDSIDLYSPKTMLGAVITHWSLRHALNISSKSWLSILFGPQQAIWGRAKALEVVEDALGIESTNSINL